MSMNAPDLSRSDDSGALSVKVKSGQPDKAEIEISRSVICARDLPVDGKQERRRVFGDRMRRICGNAHDGYLSVRRPEIDV